MNKQLLKLSTSVMLLSSGLAVISHQNVQNVYAQEEKSLSPEEESKVAEIKEKLVTSQPINEEMLLHMDDKKLLGMYEELASEYNSAGDVLWRELYIQLNPEYPGIPMIQGGECTLYFEIVKIIERETGGQWGLVELNRVEPSNVLIWYKEAFQENSEDEAATVQAIIPKLEEEYQAYEERFANLKNNIENNKRPGVQDVTNTIEDSAGEENQIDEEATEDPVQETTEDSIQETTEASTNEESNQIATEDLSQEDVFIDMKHRLLNDTLMTQEMIDQVSEQTWQSMNDISELTDSELFQTVVESEPIIFEDFTIKIRETLIQDYHVDADQVNGLSQEELIVLANQYFEGQAIDYDSFVDMLVRDYGFVQQSQVSELKTTSSQDQVSVQKDTGKEKHDDDSLLPSTGEDFSIISVVIGVIAIILGGYLFMTKKKEK